MHIPCSRFLIPFALIALSGCSALPSTEQAYQKDIFAMDTIMSITAYGSEDAVNATVTEINRLDKLLSISSDSGEIKPLNVTGSATLSTETAALLQQALSISAETDGAFDCTILPVMELWGFPTQTYAVPDPQILADTLTKVNYQQVQLQTVTDAEPSVTLPQGVEIDLGGIAKGYASDRVMQIFSDYALTSGIVSLGGNVQTLGTKPDGSPWRVAIQDPNNTEDYVGILQLTNQAAITSGGYQRNFEENGKIYHHIIDPKTGYPADSGLLSVTIVSDSGTRADGLSTALFIMGLEKGSAFWRAHADTFDAVFITSDNQIYITAGLQNQFTSKDNTAFTVIPA